jgi:cysteine dioxygenase
MQHIDRFVEGLCRIPETDFVEGPVDEHLRASPVDPASLAPYLFFEPTHYTRNLVYKCGLFELILICWDVGQASRIHNHAGQRCWMAVPIGRLAVQNYRVVGLDEETGFCRLEEASRLEMDPAHPTHVQAELPVHAVLNLPEYGERAASLHVYSRPYDRCLVYDLQKNSYMEVPLFYDSEYGRRVAPAAS